MNVILNFRKYGGNIVYYKLNFQNIVILFECWKGIVYFYKYLNVWVCFVKFIILLFKYVIICFKNVNCSFIGYVYNSGFYWFMILYIYINKL